MKPTRRNIRRTTRTMASSGRNALQAGAAATAAGQVIAARMAMGAAALNDPAKADPVEFTRMFTEKAVAMTSASQIAALRAVQMAQHAASFAMTEAAMAMTKLDKPHHAAGWYGRAMNQSMTMAHLAFQAHAAAMAPLYRAANANARRLSGR